MINLTSSSYIRISLVIRSFLPTWEAPVSFSGAVGRGAAGPGSLSLLREKRHMSSFHMKSVE